MNTYNCTICNDTGKRLLPNGQHSDYVDCSCQAATERAELDVAVTVFVQSYEGDLQNAPADTRWFVHQRAVKMQAAKVAALQAQVKELEQKHADAVQRYEELAAMPAAPSAPAVEQQPIRWLMSDGSCTADRRYGEGYGGKPLYLAPTPQAADTDKVREVLDKLHAEIMNLPANKSLHIYEDDIGQTLAYKTGHRDARHSAAELAASMAAQAPVREVPEDLQLVPKISTSKMDRAGEAVIESESHCDCGNYPMPNLEKVFSAMLAAAPVQQEGE